MSGVTSQAEAYVRAMHGVCVRTMGIRRVFHLRPGLYLLEAFREKRVEVHFIKVAVLKIPPSGIPTFPESLLSLAQTGGICFQKYFHEETFTLFKGREIGCLRKKKKTKLLFQKLQPCQLPGVVK